MERTYSIKDLELLSGIKAHTLRIWEQRYSLLSPVRTTTNIRRYSEEDLKLILNVSILNKNGYKISKIAAYSKEEIAREVYRMLATDKSTEVQLNGLRHAMITLDEEEFNRVFSNLTMRHGFEEMMIKFVYPFLELMGVLWQTGTITPLNEHFASSIIRQKITVALDMLPVPRTDKRRGFVLACPEQEFHEIGLLFANYMLRSRGFHTIYLGANVPMKDLSIILEESKLENLLLSVIVHPAQDILPLYIKTLRNQLPKSTTFYLSGRQTESLVGHQLPVKTKLLSRIDSFQKVLESI